MRRGWFDNRGRPRIPFAMRWLSAVPVPRAVRRWYYRLSVRVAGHPSNWHWKMFTHCGDDLGDCPEIGRVARRGCDLRPSERCPWCGEYCEGGLEEVLGAMADHRRGDQLKRVFS
jgi:hypothetical protein